MDWLPKARFAKEALDGSIDLAATAQGKAGAPDATFDARLGVGTFYGRGFESGRIEGTLNAGTEARFERAAAILDEAIARFEAARGRRPSAAGELVASGLLEALPPDPAGGRWVIGADGRARSTRHERRIGRAAPLGTLPPAPGLGDRPPIGTTP